MKIPVSHGQLEALLKEPDSSPRGAAVVCHPHPLYGGTMHTKAVYHSARALQDAGVVALRFNFRGVGASTGSYDGGIGEREDVVAAIDWLQSRYPRLPLIAGGFSFGSQVGLSVGASDDRVVGLFGLGLPIGQDDGYDWSFLAGPPKPTLIVQGENDEFGSGEDVTRFLAELAPHVALVRIPGADHYFTDRLNELGDAVRDYYVSGEGAELLAAV